MRHRNLLPVIAGAVAFLGITVALAFSARPDVEVATAGGYAFIVADGSEPVTVNLDALAEGETRSMRLGDRDLTLTRTREGLALDIVGADGSKRKLLVANRTAHGGVCVVGEGKDTSMVKIRRVEKSGGADDEIEVKVDTGDGVEWVDESDGRVLIVKDKEKGKDKDKVLRFAGEGEDGKTVIVMKHAGDPDGFAWVSGEAGLVAYRCPGDGTVMTIRKDKVPAAGVTCPVCGTQLQPLEGGHRQVIRKKVVETK